MIGMVMTSFRSYFRWSKQLPIKVSSVNDAPVIEGPESLETYEDIGVLVPGVTILDTDGIILKWTIGTKRKDV